MLLDRTVTNSADNSQQEFCIKLADFGFSTFFTTDKVTLNYNLGTLGYQAPELFRKGGRHDEKVDSWSTAVIAYIFLSGEQPFKRNGKVS